jgi:hypothetical protein
MAARCIEEANSIEIKNGTKRLLIMNRILYKQIAQAKPARICISSLLK